MPSPLAEAPNDLEDRVHEAAASDRPWRGFRRYVLSAKFKYSVNFVNSDTEDTDNSIDRRCSKSSDYQILIAGHGLVNDFSMLNIHVPGKQTRSSVELVQTKTNSENH